MILREKGIDFVRENFDIMKIVKEYEEVYESIGSIHFVKGELERDF